MKVITWNMGCGPRQSRYRKHHDDAWSYLLDELRPDVAFVQEALVAKLEPAPKTYDVTRSKHESNPKAGTAVLVRSQPVAGGQQVKLPCADSYVVTATVTLPEGPLVVGAVHIYPGKRQSADLQALGTTLVTTFGETPILIGGDFNAARRWDEVYHRKMCTKFFAEMNAAGFGEPHWDKYHREVQSFWGGRTQENYQDDHFFISKAWSERVLSCNVIDNEVVRRLSDHGPVVLELDVG